MELDKETYTKIFETMYKIRRVEHKLMDYFSEGKIPGFIHVCIGQEAAPAGVCTQLNSSDFIATTHRGHGHIIAKGVDLKYFMAEIFGRVNGLCKGLSGSMHVADRSSGVLGANGIVGGGISISAGVAFAFKYKKSDQIAVCFFGDGATAEGVFHETLNISSLYRLPVVFVCENNHWAQFTPTSINMPVKSVAERGKAYKIPSVTVKNDVLQIYDVTSRAIERARSGEGPTLIEVKNKRWLGHFVGDQQKYREADDVARAKKDDCIERFRKYVIKEGVLSDRDLKEIEGKVDKEIDEAIDFALKSPQPDTADLDRYVY